MSEFVKNQDILLNISEFAVVSILDAIRLSNTCHGFKEALENGSIWRELFEERWPQLKILSFDDPRFCVIKEFQLDLLCDRMPREFNKADFPKRVKKQLEVRSKKGVKCSYRYPLNWFRGFSHIFGFYGESDNQEGPVDLGPHFITQVQVVTRKVIRKQEDVQTGGRMRYVLSVSKFAGDVEEMVHRKLYYFLVDGFLRTKEAFLQKFMTFILDFSKVKHDQVRVFFEPPKDSVIQSIPPVDQPWTCFNDTPFFGIVNCEHFIDFHAMVDEYGKRNDYKHFLYKVRFSANSEEFSLEMVMMKKKVNDEKAYIESLLSPKSNEVTMSKYVKDSEVDEIVSSDMKKMNKKNKKKVVKKKKTTTKKKITKKRKVNSLAKKKKVNSSPSKPRGKLYSSLGNLRNRNNGHGARGGSAVDDMGLGSLGVSGRNVGRSTSKKKTVRKGSTKKKTRRKGGRVVRKGSKK